MTRLAETVGDGVSGARREEADGIREKLILLEVEGAGQTPPSTDGIVFE